MIKRRLYAAPLALVFLFGGSVVGPAGAQAADASLEHSHVDRVYTSHQKCQLVRISPNFVVGYIEGDGTGNTAEKARLAALRQIDRMVPKGHYKRHCHGGWSSGGGRFSIDE